jgi:hypothetical protein
LRAEHEEGANHCRAERKRFDLREVLSTPGRGGGNEEQKRKPAAETQSSVVVNELLAAHVVPGGDATAKLTVSSPIWVLTKVEHVMSARHRAQSGYTLSIDRHS